MDKLRGRIDSINDEFASRYGWGGRIAHRFPVEATPEGAYQAVRDAIDILRNQLCPAT